MWFPLICVMTHATSEIWLRSFLSGLAQLIFCSSPFAGALVAIGLGVLSPWVLLSASIGCAVGTVVGRKLPGVGRDEWRAGLTGFNPALLGILGAGAIPSGALELTFLLSSMILCVVLTWAVTGPFLKFGFFPLTAPAYVVALLTSFVLAPAGAWWWTGVESTSVFVLWPWVAVVLCVVAMTREAPEAAGWAVAAALLAYAISSIFGEDNLSDTAGLWGIVVPLSVFGASRLFGQNSTVFFSLSCGAIAGLIWVAWHSSPLAAWVPPLIAPLFLAIWLLTWICRVHRPLVAQRDFWLFVKKFTEARRRGQPIAVLTTPTAADAEIEKLEIVPSETTPEAVSDLWKIADQLRKLPRSVGDDSFVSALDAALKEHVFDLVIAGDSVGRLERIDRENKVEAFGAANRLSCTGCGKHHQWPPANIWRHIELRCDCGGQLFPDLKINKSHQYDAVAVEVAGRLGAPPTLLLVLDDSDGEHVSTRLIIDHVLGQDGTTYWAEPRRSKNLPSQSRENLIEGDLNRVIRILTFLGRCVPRNHVSPAIGSGSDIESKCKS